jgi:hypothetical protein
MKRFSIKWFVIVALLHIIGTILLFDASLRSYGAVSRAWASGQPEPSFPWLTAWAWFWQPVTMFASYYRQHHPRPVIQDTSLDELSRQVGGPSILSYSFVSRGPWPWGSTSAFLCHVFLDVDTESPRLNFVMQHLLGLKEALIGCFIAMSLSCSVTLNSLN